MYTKSIRNRYFTRDKSPVEITVDTDSSFLKNYFQSVKLLSVPSNNYQWKLIWPGGNIIFTWKTTVVNSWNEILIGANVGACITNAIATLKANYYFSRQFTAFSITSDTLKVKSKEIGTQFFIDEIGDDVVTETIAISDFTSAVLKENYQFGLSLFRPIDGIVSGESTTQILFSEQVAPVIIENENVSEALIRFNIQNAIHSITSFTAPDKFQTVAKIATGHVMRFMPSIFEIFGNPPQAKEFALETAKYAIRGGSRVENQNAFEDFVEDFIIVERNGLLCYGITKEVTTVQEQYCYWLNTIGNESVKLRVDFYFINGDTAHEYYFTYSSPVNEVLIMPLGLSQFTGLNEFLGGIGKTVDDIKKYSAAIVNSSTGAVYTSAGQFTVVESVFGEKYFLAETCYGAAEVYRCKGEISQSIEISKAEYNEFSIPDVYWENRETSQQLIQYQEVYECATGNLSRTEIDEYLNLLLSENVFEIIYVDDLGQNVNAYRYAIRIEPGTFMIKKDARDGVYLYGFSFKYRRAYTEQSLGLTNNYF